MCNKDIILLNDCEMKEVKGGIGNSGIFTCTVNTLKSARSYTTAKPSVNSLGKISTSAYEGIGHSGEAG